MNISKLNSKDITERNKAEWETMETHEMHLDVNLVKCQKGLFPEAGEKKLLYIGFGEGQNFMYFLSKGFRCYGTEIAKSRMSLLRQKLKRNNQTAILKLVNSNILPFENDFFDIVVAWQSLYYNNELGFKKSLEEIRRVLKPGGQFLSSMVSPKHNLCSKEIAPSTFRPINSAGQTNCIIYALKNKKHTREMYCAFNEVRIGFHSSFLFKTHDFHYLIYCTKQETKTV